MHVAIKQTVLDKILERIHQIKREGREPEYIAVTPEEHRDLRSDCRIPYYTTPRPWYVPPEDVAAQRIKTCDFPLRRDARGDRACQPQRFTCFTREEIAGIPLYVVPPEYMPG